MVFLILSSSISFSCSLKERSFFKRDSSLKDFTIKTAFEGLPAPHDVFEFLARMMGENTSKCLRIQTKMELITPKPTF